jgi:hypothetical protein
MYNFRAIFFCNSKRILCNECHNQHLQVSLSKKDITAFNTTLTNKASLTQRQGKFKEYIRFNNTSKNLEL